MACEYVRRYYGVPAEIGRRIEWDGRGGVIAEDHGNYIGVLFDDAKPGHVVPLHPTDGVVYLGMGKVRKLSASQRRYREFRDADWFNGTFAQWLKRGAATSDPFPF